MFNFNFDLSNKEQNNTQDSAPEDFRSQHGVESDHAFYAFQDLNENANNNSQDPNNPGGFQGFLDSLTNNSYIEKMKKNPYIRHKYITLKSEMDSGADNQALFIQFNTSPTDNYKLRGYNYASNNIKKEYFLQHYPKFYRYNYSQPRLQKYPAFNSNLYDSEIEERNQKNSEYKPLYQNWDGITEKEVINTQEYRGFYSNQYDFQLFKMIQDSEIQTKA